MLGTLRRKLQQYERLLLPAFLLGGLIVDFITFKTLNTTIAFSLLCTHLVISGSILIFLNWFDERKRKNKTLTYIRLGAPFILQFSFGALLSASFIFYWFSGAFSVSWPFILLIAFLMMSNDVFRHYYLRPVVQVGVYYFILFSLSALILPFLVRSIDEWVWIVSGSASLLLMYGGIELLGKKLKSFSRQKGLMVAVIILIFAFMNALYFLRIIPPIPLAIRDAGVYYNVERVGTDYVVEDEHRTAIDRLLPGKVMHITQDDRLYIFSAIFAPTDLGTVIVHEWEYKGENGWEDRSSPRFTITGGRDGGFRGWSYSSRLQEGKWRVTIKTVNGQVLGRVRFSVELVDEAVSVYKEVK